MEDHIKGIIKARNKVKGPKIKPRDKTAKLGKNIKLFIKLCGKNRADKMRPALTILPTTIWGWPKEKGTANDKKPTRVNVKYITLIGKIIGRFLFI